MKKLLDKLTLSMYIGVVKIRGKTMNTYHKRFLSSHSAENLVMLFSRYRGAAKEITESWGMLEAAKKYIDDFENYFVVVIGDGCSPRTGALFSYFTSANVISIDPNMNMEHWGEHCKKQKKIGLEPKRIEVIRGIVEDMNINCFGKNCLVVWPHSHAEMGKEKIENYKKRIDIALPCCIPVPKKLMEIPHIVYDDYNIESPKRTIHIWENKI